MVVLEDESASDWHDLPCCDRLPGNGATRAFLNACDHLLAMGTVEVRVPPPQEASPSTMSQPPIPAKTSTRTTSENLWAEPSKHLVITARSGCRPEPAAAKQLPSGRSNGLLPIGLIRQFTNPIAWPKPIRTARALQLSAPVRPALPRRIICH